MGYTSPADRALSETAEEVKKTIGTAAADVRCLVKESLSATAADTEDGYSLERISELLEIVKILEDLQKKI